MVKQTAREGVSAKHRSPYRCEPYVRVCEGAAVDKATAWGDSHESLSPFHASTCVRVSLLCIENLAAAQSSPIFVRTWFATISFRQFCPLFFIYFIHFYPCRVHSECGDKVNKTYHSSKRTLSVLFLLSFRHSNHLLQQVMASQHDDKDNEKVKENMRNSPTSK